MAFTFIDCANVSNGIFFPGSGCSPVDGLPYARFTESWGIRYSSPDPTWAFSSAAPILLGYISSGTNFGAGNLLACGCISIGTTGVKMPLTFKDALGGKILLNDNANNYSIGLASGVVSADASMKFTAGCSTPGDVTFYRGSTLSMIIACTGNVGIGTTSPGARLDVCGADGRIQSRVDSSDGSTVNVRPNSGKCGWISYTEDAVADRWGIGIKNGDAKLYFASGNVSSGGGTTRMVLDGSGNAGIGSNSPSGRLDVARNGEAYSLGQSTYDPYAIAGTQMNITSNASGCANTATFIHFGAYNATGGNTNLYLGAIATACSNGPACFSIGRRTAVQGWTESLRIDTNGNVGINQSTPSYMLHVNGTFYAAGSSQDYKEGVCKYDTDSCMFMKLKPVTYQYKDEFKHLGKELKSQTQIGLIAEEVAEVAPELAILVKENEEKVVRNVDYEKLTIVLLSEVQKLRKELDDLKTK